MSSYKQLFSFPLQLIITGRSRSGKSYMVRNHIIPHIINQYDAVIIYSPSAHLDAGWKGLKKRYPSKVTLIPEINDKDIANFIHEIGKRKVKGKKTKFLFIFDDITTYLTPSNTSFFATLATRGRHFNISFIITSHKYKAFNSLLRNNATQQIFFKITTNLELNSISEEIATVETPPHVIKKLLRACTGSHKAFLVNKGAEEDNYFCLLPSGKFKQVFSIHEIVEELEERGEDFTDSDYNVLQRVMTNENVIFV
jgi:hypothetical protein